MPRRDPRTPRPTAADVDPAAGRRTATLAGPGPDADPDAVFAARLGEWLRRVALGATAALVSARAYWSSEPDYRIDAGDGAAWAAAVLVVAGLAVASALVGGVLRLRWSWADAAVIALALIVGTSAGHAVDRRPAINLAWEWGAVALAYLLVRNLPRTRGESTALAGGLAATAAAVAAYGLYQAGVEIPDMQARFLSHKVEWLRAAGVTPGTPSAVTFEHRLMHSNEPYSTFALANSLAGYLVGPLVVMLAVFWSNLTRGGGGGRGARAAALALGAVPTAAVLLCLVLTKSRSAYVGLAAALAVLAFRERTRVRARTLALGVAGALVVGAGLAAAGLATGRLDPQVLTEAGKSFRYRQEYWVGAWRAINETPRSFWAGFGPGNFAAPYVRHKLPEASEEITDPHNFLLEVWSSGGLWAVVAVCLALLIGFRNAFGPPRPKPAGASGDEPPEARPSPAVSEADPSAPPVSAGWLLVCAAAGWVVVLFVGQMKLIEGGQFERWMILGAAWALAVACGLPLWKRLPLDAAALGAGALAVVVNLLAAGGIGFAAVSLGLWSALALAMNLRDDRPCGRPREGGGRVGAFLLAGVWVALLGTYVGAVGPYWRASAAMADAEDALRARPPEFERAEAAYDRAKLADHFSALPWLGTASLEYQRWTERGARPKDLLWRKIPIELYKAVEPPRAPDSWSRHRERAIMTTMLLRQLGSNLSPQEMTKYRANVVEASRKAARLYPTNASLRARLAEASAEIGMTPDALTEGKTALALDARTPHADKKLDPSVRVWLEGKVPEWEKAVSEAESIARPRGASTPKPKPAAPAK